MFQVTSEAQILRTESSGSNQDFTYRVPEMEQEGKEKGELFASILQSLCKRRCGAGAHRCYRDGGTGPRFSLHAPFAGNKTARVVLTGPSMSLQRSLLPAEDNSCAVFPNTYFCYCLHICGARLCCSTASERCPCSGALYSELQQCAGKQRWVAQGKNSKQTPDY